MKTIKGPAIFLAQFAGDAAPFNSLDSICDWAASLGYEGVQIPSWDSRLFNLERAAGSKDYCDLVKGTVEGHGLKITELSTHLQGQLVAVHPAYDEGFDAFAAPQVRGNPKARQEWAVQQMLWGAKASRHLGLDAHVTFSGALAYPYLYPWPPRPKGLIDTAFTELAKRWRPILDAFDEQGVDVCYEIHPGEDLLDGASFERFLGKVDNHPALLHQLRPVALRAAGPGLSAVHRLLPRADQGVPRQGRRAQPDRQAGCLWRLRGLGRPGRPLPLAGRRRGRFLRHLQQAHRLRLRLLGRARVGMLPQERRGRRARGGGVHRRGTSSR